MTNAKLDYQRRMLIQKLMRESAYIAEEEAIKIANWTLCNGGGQKLESALKRPSKRRTSRSNMPTQGKRLDPTETRNQRG